MIEKSPLLEKAAFSERLTQALIGAGYATSAAALAREFNALYLGAPVTPHACRKWLLGESIPTQDKLVVLAQLVGKTPDWLRFGAAAKLETLAARNSVAQPNKRERELIEAVHKLSRRDQELIAAMVRELTKHSKASDTEIA